MTSEGCVRACVRLHTGMSCGALLFGLVHVLRLMSTIHGAIVYPCQRYITRLMGASTELQYIASDCSWETESGDLLVVIQVGMKTDGKISRKNLSCFRIRILSSKTRLDSE
jgi:hypothetical protein